MGGFGREEPTTEWPGLDPATLYRWYDATCRNRSTLVRRLFFALTVTTAVLAAAVPGHAQTSSQSLFERYLESLRLQAGIPGRTAALVQDGPVVWESGLGYRDVENLLPAFPDTPFQVGDLTQTLAATLLWQCAERGQLDLTAPMRQWTDAVPEASAEVRHVMAHASEATPGSAFKYSPARFAALTPVIERCGGAAYRTQLSSAILERFAMVDSVPGPDLATPGAPARSLFEAEDLARYEAALARMAAPYKVDRNGKASRSEYPAPAVDAAIGLVTTARDLARFDAALTSGVPLTPESLALAWSNVVSTTGQPLPTGLGWFVQTYNGERVVWSFGSIANASSALVLHVPSRKLTLVLLANSDGLNTAGSLGAGDVTVSPFARLFLRLFLP
jgi:CubicO group peptidase (beta-lactamase class C family)